MLKKTETKNIYLCAPETLKRAAILNLMNMSDIKSQSNPENSFGPYYVNVNHSGGICTEQLTFKKNRDFRL